MAGKTSKAKAKAKPKAKPTARKPPVKAKAPAKPKPTPKALAKPKPKPKALAKPKLEPKATAKPTATQQPKPPTKKPTAPKPSSPPAGGGGFPFLYYQHGTISLDSIGKASGAYIAFRGPVPDARRKDVMAGCPESIGGLWSWGPNLVSCESPGDVFDWMLAERYADGEPELLDDAAVAAFAADVETWIRGVHAKFPVLFFLGPNMTETESPWGVHSAAALAGVMVPFLEQYAVDNADLLGKAAADEDYGDDGTGKFDQTSMSCILQYVPDRIPEPDLARRAKALANQFPL